MKPKWKNRQLIVGIRLNIWQKLINSTELICLLNKSYQIKMPIKCLKHVHLKVYRLEVPRYACNVKRTVPTFFSCFFSFDMLSREILRKCSCCLLFFLSITSLVALRFFVRCCHCRCRVFFFCVLIWLHNVLLNGLIYLYFNICMYVYVCISLSLSVSIPVPVRVPVQLAAASTCTRMQMSECICVVAHTVQTHNYF